MASREEAQKNFGKIVAKAWQDEEFKARLISDTRAVLKENGIEAPEGIDVKVVENTDKLVHFILPPKPAGGELTDDALENVSGGQEPLSVCSNYSYLSSPGENCGGGCVASCVAS